MESIKFKRICELMRDIILDHSDININWFSEQTSIIPSYSLSSIKYKNYEDWLIENKIKHELIFDEDIRLIKINFTNEEDAALFLLKWN